MMLQGLEQLWTLAGRAGGVQPRKREAVAAVNIKFR